MIEQSQGICASAMRPIGSRFPNSPCMIRLGTAAFQMPSSWAARGSGREVPEEHAVIVSARAAAAAKKRHRPGNDIARQRRRLHLTVRPPPNIRVAIHTSARSFAKTSRSSHAGSSPQDDRRIRFLVSRNSGCMSRRSSAVLIGATFPQDKNLADRTANFAYRPSNPKRYRRNTPSIASIRITLGSAPDPDLLCQEIVAARATPNRARAVVSRAANGCDALCWTARSTPLIAIQASILFVQALTARRRLVTSVASPGTERRIE